MDSKLLLCAITFMVAISHCGATHCSEIVLTKDDILGPYYIEDMPYRPDGTFAENPDDTLLIVDGFIGDRNCHHITCASVHVWAAGNDGEYLFAWPYRLRARVIPDRQGYYRYQTSLPGYYGGRPLHVHVGVELGGAFFVTQLYFADDPRADGMTQGDVQPKVVVSSSGGRVVWQSEFPLILDVDVNDLHEQCGFQSDPLHKAVRLVATLRSDAVVADEQLFLFNLKGELLAALRSSNETIHTRRLETRLESTTPATVVVEIFPTIAPQAESSPDELAAIVVDWYSHATADVWSGAAMSLVDAAAAPSVEEVEVILCEFGHWVGADSTATPPWPPIESIPADPATETALEAVFPSSLSYGCPAFANYIMPNYVDPFPPQPDTGNDDDGDDNNNNNNDNNQGSTGSGSASAAVNLRAGLGLMWSGLLLLLVQFKAAF